MAEQTFDPRFDPAFQRGYVPPAKPQVVPAVPLPVDSIGEPPAGSDPKSPEDAEPEAVVVVGRHGVNPYVVILWVVGVVFVLGGAALLFGSYFMLYARSLEATPEGSATTQTLYVVGSAFGVPLITVGLATIAGLIFFSAWRSSQRRESTTS